MLLSHLHGMLLEQMVKHVFKMFADGVVLFYRSCIFDHAKLIETDNLDLVYLDDELQLSRLPHGLLFNLFQVLLSVPISISLGKELVIHNILRVLEGRVKNDFEVRHTYQHVGYFVYLDA